MIELEKVFHHVEEYDGDVWVADYTEATQIISSCWILGICWKKGECLTKSNVVPF